MKFLTFLTLFALALSCTPEPKAINYGEEACAYCQMTIVDKQYAAQLVTAKGKAYSFDAAECMIRHKKEHEDKEWSYVLVTDYRNPTELIPAKEAVFVRSEELPSPMGAYLTAVPGEESGKELVQKHGGKIYNYSEVESAIDNLPSL